MEAAYWIGNTPCFSATARGPRALRTLLEKANQAQWQYSNEGHLSVIVDRLGRFEYFPRIGWINGWPIHRKIDHIEYLKERERLRVIGAQGFRLQNLYRKPRRCPNAD